MWCGLKPLTAVLIAVATLLTPMTPGNAPSTGPSPSTSDGLQHVASCKALPPFAVDAVAVAGSAERWRLTLQTLDSDRDVKVWMHTSPDDRRLVWQGRLTVGDPREVEATYAAPTGSERVFVALEPADMGTAILRGLSVATLAAPARMAPVSKGLVLEDPTTGVTVRQFTGAQGGPR